MNKLLRAAKRQAEETSLYWYNLRMLYLLAEPNIGHTSPSVKERWEWAVQELSMLKSTKKTTRFLERELHDEGITLPMK